MHHISVSGHFVRSFEWTEAIVEARVCVLEIGAALHSRVRAEICQISTWRTSLPVEVGRLPKCKQEQIKLYSVL